MTLCFILTVLGLFALVLAFEGQGEPNTLPRPAGLIRWLAAGNWTAKLGALLLTIGTGALLRYAMVNFDCPPQLKILAGLLIAGVLAIVAALPATRARWRAISLALTGASLAVCYLTAYGAYAFFHFVPDAQALGLLIIVAGVATAVAIARNALSIAVLAMAGAFLAPAFALQPAGPVPVYGYYVLASLLALFMVWLRGWRPLIHLSFLFTLGGALFFGWTQKYYVPAYYPQMRTLLLALVSIHVAMPLLERRGAGRAATLWTQHLDRIYFFALPLAAAVLTLVLAPRLDHEGVTGLLALALLWFLAWGWQSLRAPRTGVPYLCIAIVLAVSAALLAKHDLSVFLTLAVLSSLVLMLASRLPFGRPLELLAISAALATSAFYVWLALFEGVAGTPLLNLPFLEHVLLGAALIGAGWTLHRRGQTVGHVFLVFAGTWLFVAVGRELFRLHAANLTQVAYLATLLGILVSIVVCQVRRIAPDRRLLVIAAALLLMTGFGSADKFAPGYVLPLLLAGQVLLSALAFLSDRIEPCDEFAGALGRSLLPLILWPWAIALCHNASIGSEDAVWTLLVASALLASLQAQWLVRPTFVWPNWLSPVGFIAFGILLLNETLTHIVRERWAVAFELLCVLYLAETARFLAVQRHRDAARFGYAAAFAVACVSAAMLLRLIGPPGALTILALNRMLSPALVSLLWTVLGCAATWYSTRNHSRTLWSIGAALLLAAAAKFILFDFGSLGQIRNILATLGAGGVFLLVAWLAPFPPQAAVKPDAATPTRESYGFARGWLWVTAGLAAVLGVAYLYRANNVSPPQIVRAPTAQVALQVPQVPPTWQEQLTPSTPQPGSSPTSVPDVCQQFALALPSDYVIYGAGDGDAPGPAESGPQLINVRITAATHNVVLALGSTGPTVWRMDPYLSTQVVGVILSGENRSSVVGVLPGVPVLHAAHADNAPCGYFQINAAAPQGANRFVSHLLVTAMSGYYVPRGEALLIEPLPGTAPAFSPVTADPTQHTLQIQRALYSGNASGRGLDMTAAVQSQCQPGSRRCLMHCGNEIAGDPAFGEPKICRIIFSCGRAAAQTIIYTEGANMQFGCE